MKLDDEPQQDPQIKKDFARYPKLRLKDILLLTPLQRAIYTSNLMKENDMNEYINNLNKNILEITIKELSEIVQKTWATQELLMELRAKFKICQLFAKFSLFNYSQATKFCIVIDKLIILFMNSSKEDRGSLLKQEKKFKVLSPIVKSLLHIAINFNDQMIISHLKQERELEKVHFFHTKSAIGIQIAQNVLNIMTLIRELAPSFTMEDFQNQNEDKDIKDIKQQQQSPTQDNTNDKQNSKQKLIHNDLMKNQFLNYWENPKVNRVLRNITRNCFNILDLFFGVYECYSVPFTLLSMSPYSEVFFSIYCNILTQFELDFVLRIRDFTKQIEKNLHLVTNGFKTDELNNILEQVVNECKIKEIEYRHHIHNSSTCIEEDNKLLAQKEKLTELIPINCDNDKYLSFRKQRIAFDGKIDDVTKLKLLINKTYLIPIVFRIIKTFHTLSQNKGHNFSIERSLCQRIIKIAFFFISNNVDNSIYFLMSDITRTIELLNGEQLHGMLDLVQQALITIRYHSVEITINSNLMRLIKVATTKANSVKLIEKVLKIISTILKVNFNNEQNSLKKLRKIVIALYKSTETLNISCKTLLLQNQQQQHMIETDERVYRLIKNFLRITNYLFEGSVFLDERKFLETILTKDEICTVLKQKHLEFSIRKEIITLYRITYIDVSVKKNNINYYISLLINDPPKSAVGIGYMKYLNFFYKLLTIKVSQRYLLNKKESKVKDTQVNNTNDNNNNNSNKDCTYKILKIELDQMKQLLFNNDLVIHNSKKKKYIEALLKAVFVYLSKMTGYIVHSGEDERKQFHRMLIGFLELKKFIYQHKDIFTEHIDDKKRRKNLFRNKLCSWGKERKSFINYPQSTIEKDIEELTQEIIHLKKKNFDFSNFTTLNQIFQSHQYKFLNKPIFPNIKNFFEKRSTLFPNEQHDKKKTYLQNNNLLNTNFQMNLFNLITKYLNGKMALTHSYLIKMLNDDNKVFNVKNRVLLVKSSFFFMTNHNFVWSYRDTCLWNIFRLLQFDTNETQKNCFELFNRRRKKLLDFNSLIDILTENLMSIILREMNPCITMIKHDYYRTVLIIKIMKYLCEEHNHDFQRIFFSKEYDGVAINYSSTPFDNANNNKDDNKNDSIDNVFGIANINMERPVAVSKKNLFENKLFSGNNATNNGTPRKIKSLQYNNDTTNWGKLRNKKPNPDTEIEDLHEVTLSEEYLLEIQKNSASVFEYMLSIVGKIMLLSRWIISKENEKFDQFLYDLYFVILEFLIETIQGTKQDYILSIINQNNESPDLFGNVLQDIKLLIFKENNSEIAFQVKKDSFDFLMAFLEECETPERLLFKISSVILPTEIPKKMVTTMCLLYNEQNETNSQNVNDNESSYSNNSIHIEKNLHMFSPEMKKYFMNLYYNDLSLRNDIKFALTNRMFQYFKLYAVEERYLNSAAADFYNKLMSFRECKVNKIYNTKDENNTETLIDSGYYDQYLCLLFFESITGVVFVNSPSANMPTRVLFTINPNVSFISKLTKEEFLNTVDRSNRLSKLKGLMETCDEFFEEINFKVSSGKISKIKSYIIDMNFYWLEMASCAITLVVNLIMLVKVGGVGETMHFISTNDALLNVLGFINFIFNVLVLVLWFYTKFIIYYNSECQKQLRKKEEISKRLSLFEIEDPEKPKLSIYEKAKIAFIVIVLKNKTTSFVWNGVMSGVGAFMNTHFLFVLQMLSAINLSEDIKAMLWFIFKKLTQLVLIFFFIAIFNLIFATIAFFNFSQDWIRFISAKEQIAYPSSFSFLNDLIGSPYIEEQSYENYCGTLLYCFFTHLSYGMRYDGGIADNMKLASFTNNRSYYVPRFFYDELYFVFLVVLSLGMISSTIYTIGNDWINKVRFIKRDINEICFICGIDRAICEREGETFKEHKKKKHNIWKYVEYMIGLKYVDIQETNAINSYVIESLEKKVVGWVPVKNEGD